VWSGEWKDTYKVPMKPDENLENPQLLTKCLANLLHWLNQGTFKSLAAKTFMEYIHFIHSKSSNGRDKPESDIFGGCSQQDAQEFYSFIMDNIHDETNVRRDRKPPKEEKPYTPKDGTIIQNAVDYWRDYSKASASVVDKYFRGLEVFISRCHNSACRQEIRLFQPCDVWILNLAGMDDPTDLDSLLANHQTSEHFPDLVCETCNRPGRTRKAKFARLPDRLAFCLNRFNSAGGGGFSNRLMSSGKIHSKVRFPIRDLDLTRYCAEPDPDMATTDDRHFAGKMRYDCYAVTVHVGQGINGGHYYSYVQDETSKDPSDWFRCNDDVVDRVKIGSGQPGDLTETMYQNGNTSAYMVYYRRRGT
jgi:ubiquitin carboxyl-terminal hydrolase 8